VADDWIRDKESARRIRKRTEKLSTAAKYSNEPAALLLDYYDFHKNERLECPRCGWTGQASDASSDHHAELFDVSCPSCEKMLLIVSFPTTEETKQAAGNEEAEAALPGVEQMEARWARAAELALKADSDFPSSKARSCALCGISRKPTVRTGRLSSTPSESCGASSPTGRVGSGSTRSRTYSRPTTQSGSSRCSRPR